MLTTLIPAIGSLNYISGMGLNETENLQSLSQLVIDNEIVMMVKRVLEGINVDPDHIAADLIIKKGPGSHFLDDEHTLAYFREELSSPELSNRATYEKWADRGSFSVDKRAAQKALELLQHNPESELDSKTVAKIYKIVEDAE